MQTFETKITNVRPNVPISEFLPSTVADSLEIIDTTLSFEECKVLMANFLMEKGYVKISDRPEFKLANTGNLSRCYFNIKDALVDDRIARALQALMIVELRRNGINDEEFIQAGSNGVGGAIPVAELIMSRPNTTGFIDRGEVKGYGMKTRVVGDIKGPETRKILFDDVFTTGGNMSKTNKYLVEELNDKFDSLFVFVNRSDFNEETGLVPSELKNRIPGTDVPVYSLFTAADFMNK